MSQKKDKLLSATMSVTLIILLSKGAGFIREMIIAYYFGSDAITDAYNSAYSLFYLPVLLFSSCITSTLVPLYIKRENKRGRLAADRFASNAVNLFGIFSIIVSLIMFVFAPQLVALVYPGFQEETFQLAVVLSRIMYPALVFFVSGVVLSTLLNAQEHYLAAQLTGLPLSFALILAATLFSRRFGIYAQAWGVVAAGVLQLVILYPSLRKSFHYTLVADPRDKGFNRLLKLAVPAVLSMAVNELNHMVDRMLASSLNAGDISAMSYAFKLVTFMLGVLVVPLTTISFSKMSKEAVKSNKRTIIPYARKSLHLLLFAILPISIMAAVCSRDIIQLVYGRGAFSNEDVVVTGFVFLFYVVGVPFFGLRDLMNRVFHSLQDTKTPMIIACVSMAVNIVLNIILRGLMGVNGLAFATAVAALVGVALLSIQLSKRLTGIFSRAFVVEVLKICIASAVMLGVMLVLNRLLPASASTITLILRILALCASAAVSYAACCELIRVRTISRLLKNFKRS